MKDIIHVFARRKSMCIACFVLLILLGLWIVGCSSPPPEPPFVAGQPPMSGYNIFDFGVTDINHDGVLDIFTANHIALQNLLIGDGTGGFVDRFTQWRLEQNPGVPYLENTDVLPSLDQEGLNIFWYRSSLYLRSVGLDGSITGTIEFFSSLKIFDKKSVDIDITQQELATGAPHSTLRFQIKGNGWLIMKPEELQTAPIRFHFDDDLQDINVVKIGAKQIKAPGYDFTLLPIDRHGMAWADYNGDKLLDLFITRDGLKGRMSQVPYDFSDELFANTGSSFENRILRSGILKHNCSGRKTEWVDVDNDMRLDLYLQCVRQQPNQLYHQQADGTFTNIAPQAGLDLLDLHHEDDTFEFFDVDNDRDMDLVMASQSQFAVYRNDSGAFTPHVIGKSPGNITKLAVADYDSDGDLDIFAVSPQKNSLLLNSNGTYAVTDPALIGLPVRGLTANWVDYDNDGLTDLHCVPGGLYRQHSGRSFKQVHESFFETGPSQMRDARIAWFDANNDGTRDVIIATRPASGITWDLTFYRNQAAGKNNWIQLQLIGPRGNRQAIGAQVLMVSPQSTHLQQIGIAEGSHYSQGHYRLYFGLGKATRPDSLQIAWPDGKIQTISEPESNRVLTIQYDSSAHPL